MTKITAKLERYQKSPRKVRLVADLLRGKKVLEAQKVLMVINKTSAKPLLKLLNSAIANAKHNFNLKAEDLKVSVITVNEGMTMRRFMPRAHGSATPILKRSSKVYLELSEIEPKAEEKKEEVKKTEIKEKKSVKKLKK